MQIEYNLYLFLLLKFLQFYINFLRVEKLIFGSREFFYLFSYIKYNIIGKSRIYIARPNKRSIYMPLGSTTFPAYAFPSVAFARVSLSISESKSLSRGL